MKTRNLWMDNSGIIWSCDAPEKAEIVGHCSTHENGMLLQLNKSETDVFAHWIGRIVAFVFGVCVASLAVVGTLVLILALADKVLE